MSLETRKSCWTYESYIDGKQVIIGIEEDEGRPSSIEIISANSDGGLGLEVDGLRTLELSADPLFTLFRLSRMEGNPSGEVRGHPSIKTASSPYNFAAKLVLLEYYGLRINEEGSLKNASSDPDIDPSRLRGYNRLFFP